MATVISICSNALLRLGQSPIASFNDESDHARLCANLWPSIYDRTLRTHPWSCAIKRVTLSAEVASPEFEYKYRFPLPGDWIRTLSIGINGKSEDYKQEGNRILTNESVVYLRYVFRQDIDLVDDSVVEVLTCAMASEMAYPVTQSASMQQVMQEKYLRALVDARSINAQEIPPIEFGSNSLYEARFGSLR